MKKYYLIVLLLMPLFSMAQSNYKSGYVINLNGDTLHGYIDLKEWGHNPTRIDFKQNQGDKAKQLGLSDINYFEISGYERYQKYRVSVSLNPVDISSPPSVGDTKTEIDTVFLKILQKGKNVTLYVYRDGLKQRFYIKDNSMQVPVELFYGIYQDPNNSVNIINKNTYQNQLDKIALKYNPAADDLVDQIQRSGYNENDLEPIVAQINGNTREQASVRSGSKNAPVRFFAGGAFNSGSVKDGGYYGSPGSSANYAKITVGADLITNPDVGHLIFRLELGYAYALNSYSFTSRPDPIYNIADPDVSAIKTKGNIGSITPQVIYNIYNADKLKVFLDAGYSFNFCLQPSTEITTSTNEGVVSSSKTNTFLDGRNNYSVFQFKGGVVLNKRLEIYGAYFPGTDVSYSLKYTVVLTSYQVGLNYFLGKVAH